jgi:hypothetical protein
MPSCFARQENPFPNRHVAHLQDGETLEVLAVDMESPYCSLQYLSDIDLGRPDAVRRRALEILNSYADVHSVANSCQTIALLPTAWGDDVLMWRAMELGAERDANGTWSIR